MMRVQSITEYRIEEEADGKVRLLLFSRVRRVHTFSGLTDEKARGYGERLVTAWAEWLAAHPDGKL